MQNFAGTSRPKAVHWATRSSVVNIPYSELCTPPSVPALRAGIPARRDFASPSPARRVSSLQIFKEPPRPTRLAANDLLGVSRLQLCAVCPATIHHPRHVSVASKNPLTFSNTLGNYFSFRRSASERSYRRFASCRSSHVHSCLSDFVGKLFEGAGKNLHFLRESDRRSWFSASRRSWSRSNKLLKPILEETHRRSWSRVEDYRLVHLRSQSIHWCIGSVAHRATVRNPVSGSGISRPFPLSWRENPSKKADAGPRSLASISATGFARDKGRKAHSAKGRPDLRWEKAGAINVRILIFPRGNESVNTFFA